MTASARHRVGDVTSAGAEGGCGRDNRVPVMRREVVGSAVSPESPHELVCGRKMIPPVKHGFAQADSPYR